MDRLARWLRGYAIPLVFALGACAGDDCCADDTSDEQGCTAEDDSSGGCDGAGAGGPCASDWDCDLDLVCCDGVCRADCTDDCAVDDTCPDPPTGQSTVTIHVTGWGQARAGGHTCDTGETCSFEVDNGTTLYVVSAPYYGARALDPDSPREIDILADREIYVGFDGGWGRWPVRIGGARDDRLEAVATDLAGRTIAAGSFGGPVVLGTTQYDPLGGSDAAVVSLDAEGAVVWVAMFGSAGDDAARAVAVDPDTGLVVVTGTYGDTLDLGDGVTRANRGGLDGFVVGLDPETGALAFARDFGGAGDDIPGAIALAPGRIDVAGTHAAALTLGAVDLTAAPGVFVAALDDTGADQWAFDLPGSGFRPDVHLAALGGGGAVGFSYASFDPGTGPVASAGASDFAIVRYDASGGRTWTRMFGGSAGDAITGLAPTAAGNLGATGWFTDDLELGGGPLPAYGNLDGFVLELDAAGDHVASRSIGGLGADSPGGLLATAAGGWRLALDFTGRTTLGGTDYDSRGGSDLAWLELSAAGEVTSIDILGGSGTERARALATGVVLGASSTGDAELGDLALPARGGSDWIVLRY